MRRVLIFLLVMVVSAQARTFHVDSATGEDANSGLTENAAWQSLARANTHAFGAGDHLLLKRGSRFEGGLKLQLKGTAEQPIVIGAYGEGRLPILDAAGTLAGVHLRNSHHVVVRDLAITADGGKTRDGSEPARRYGVWVQGLDEPTSRITLDSLTIYKVYPEKATEHEGRNPTTYLGTAIAIEAHQDHPSSHFIVRNCRIAQTGYKAIALRKVQQVMILDNRMEDIGGPAIQPGVVDDLTVRGNIVNGSGSSLDPRMHGRGSGIWPWGCNRVLIEKNRFMHARGKGDSCGIHIDFNCRDVVVQYNLSVDNEGGFVEILGNNFNCAYRYNISINDGARVKGKGGAHQEGKVLWTSGFVGTHQKKQGPINSYIYNNTVYVGPGRRSCFSIAPTTEGLLIANNIFHLMGETEDVLGDQDQRRSKRIGRIPRSLVSHNLYLPGSVLPDSLPLVERDRILGDPQFRNPGGLEPTDYIPGDASLVKDRGLVIPLLEGDPDGLRTGLAVTQDFFGNRIRGIPDIGAVQMSR